MYKAREKDNVWVPRVNAPTGRPVYTCTAAQTRNPKKNYARTSLYFWRRRSVFRG